MKEIDVRKKVVDTAVAWLGRKESDGSHKTIIDLYNSHKPLARGYAVKYTDAWCATFASAVAIKAGFEDIIPLECGCGEFIKLAQKMGIWVENDAYIPEPADLILYDWDDGTNYAVTDNKGNPKHIGIVVSVSNGKFKVIEGNKNNTVGYRELALNGRYIRGFVAPKYHTKATTPDEEKTEAQTPTGAETIYVVKKGDTISKIASKYGKTYQQLAEHNGIKNPNVINVGQKIRIPGTGSATKPVSRSYTVKKGDSLWAIAVKQLGDGTRYKEIKELNGLKSNTIYTGQVLKLPNR